MPQRSVSEGDEPASPWVWFLFGLATLVAVGAALYFRTRRTRETAPAIERPAPVLPEIPAPVFEFGFTPVKLTRSFMFATLDYRLAVHATPELRDAIDIEVSLSSARPKSSGPDDTISAREQHSPVFAESGEAEIAGRLQLHNADIAPIRQGSGAIMVPLVHVIARSNGATLHNETYAIGQRAEGHDRLQPFRYDGPPRSWDALAWRAVDDPQAALPAGQRPLDAAAMAS